MQADPAAQVEGYIVGVDEAKPLDGRGMVMQWVRARDGEVIIPELHVAPDGHYEVPEIPADEVYKVYINEVLGIPAAVIPAEGDNKQTFKWDTTFFNVGISGKVWAYDGQTPLPGVQRFGLWDPNPQVLDWAWPTTPTQDMGGWQAPPNGCQVVGGRTYDLYINYGPGHYEQEPVGTVYVPGSGINGNFRRNSGTALVKVSVAHQGGDRMVWKESTTQITKPAFDVYPSPGVLVSAPAASGGTVYTVLISSGGGPWLQPTSPKPFTLNRLTGAGSQAVTFVK
ncbi:MAG: hypothetical protein FJX74_25620 [Armatimonadetes bacterium]|nr:hypothetical protein [Armatimonadota bacterium]